MQTCVDAGQCGGHCHRLVMVLAERRDDRVEHGCCVAQRPRGHRRRCVRCESFEEEVFGTCCLVAGVLFELNGDKI